MIRRRQLGLGLGLAAGLAAGARAQGGYPTRPITIVSAYPPGASTDLVARALAQRMTQTLGVSLVVESRSGGNGMLGSDHVARARPDGYTLQVGHNGSHGLIPLFSRNPPYDPLRDFSFIALAAAAPTALSIHPSIPASTLPELLAWARANPDRLQVGTSGIGSHHHLAAEMLARRSGLSFVHVPFRGGAEALTALLGGHISLLFGTLSTALAAGREGKVKVIALADAERAATMPELPAIGETLPGFAVPAIVLAMFGPAGMEPALVARLNAAANEAIGRPEYRARMTEAGMVPLAGTPERCRAQFAADIAAFRRIMQEADLRPE